MGCSLDLDWAVSLEARRAALAVLEDALPPAARPRTARDRCRWEDLLARIAEALGFWRIEAAGEQAGYALARCTELEGEIREVQALADRRHDAIQKLTAALAEARRERNAAVQRLEEDARGHATAP